MNGEATISSFHRDRLAAIYLRQSSMVQAREHTESTTRQYGLADEAVRLVGPPRRGGDRHRSGVSGVGRGQGGGR